MTISDGEFSNGARFGSDLILVNTDNEDDTFHMIEINRQQGDRLIRTVPTLGRDPVTVGGNSSVATRPRHLFDAVVIQIPAAKMVVSLPLPVVTEDGFVVPPLHVHRFGADQVASCGGFVVRGRTAGAIEIAIVASTRNEGRLHACLE